MAKAEEIVPTEEELEAFFEKTAKNVGAAVEDVKRYFGEKFLTEELKRDKALDLLVENAVATDKPEEVPADGETGEAEEQTEEKPAETAAEESAE